jgi:peptidoglycan/LPS O-acetylase OafA/YrhL
VASPRIDRALPTRDRGSPYGGGLRYAPGLDGIRAVAVAGVLLYHARVERLPGGFLGVDVFFVLSGYLITSLLLVEHRRHGSISLGRFWAGRARRLLPAATLVIAVCLLLAAAFLRGNLASARGDALASVLYFNNWHQILASHSYFATFARPSLLQHYWSLAVEEQFYLVWPLVLAAGLASRRRGWIVPFALAVAVASAGLMAVLYRPGADPSRVYYGTDTRATPLMIGAILAFAWPLGRLTPTAGRGAPYVLDGIGAAGLALIALAMLSWHDYDPFLYRGGFMIAALGAAAAIAAAAHPASHVARALGAGPSRWIGQRSYGIYLWHWPVMALSRPGIDLSWSAWALVPAQLAATVALAALSYRYVEMPIRRGEAQRQVRAWLDQRRPRQRLGALLAGAGGIAALALTVALLPAAGARPTVRLAASIAARRAIVAQPRPPAPGLSGSRSARSLRAGGGSGRVLAVGASVMLAAEPQLQKALSARVDAAVGRQPDAIIRRLQAYRDAGLLPNRVVVQIGDNGPVWYADMVALHKVLRGVSNVVLVNIREPTSWEAEVNEQLRQAVQTWPQAKIANWWRASRNGALLYDGAHPDDAGAAVYAQVIARALRS